MTDGDALLAAICANPEDDAPRLVYADWLDEHGGNPGLASSIRWQCHKEQRLNTYIVTRGTVFTTLRDDGIFSSLRCPEWCESVVVARGFLHSLTCTAADWLAHGDAILSRHPVRQVRLTTWPGLEYEPGHYDRVRLVGDAKWLSVARLAMELDVTKPPENLDAFAYCNRDQYLALHVRWPGVAFELPPEPRVTLTRPGDMDIRLVSAVR